MYVVKTCEPIANATRGRRAGTSPAAGTAPNCGVRTPLLAAWLEHARYGGRACTQNLYPATTLCPPAKPHAWPVQARWAWVCPHARRDLAFAHTTRRCDGMRHAKSSRMPIFAMKKERAVPRAV